MQPIEPYRLWIGHSGDVRDVSHLLAVGIQAVVQLTLEEPCPRLTRELTLVRIPLHDSGDNSAWQLRLAVVTTSQLLAAQVPTLVCCSAGMSRSPAIAACAIASVEHRQPAECLNSLRATHPLDVSPSLWRALFDLDSAPRGDE